VLIGKSWTVDAEPGTNARKTNTAPFKVDEQGGGKRLLEAGAGKGRRACLWAAKTGRAGRRAAARAAIAHNQFADRPSAPPQTQAGTELMRRGWPGRLPAPLPLAGKAGPPCVKGAAYPCRAPLLLLFASQGDFLE